MGRRTARRWAYALAVAILAAGLYSLAPRERLLLQEATRVTAIDPFSMSASMWRTDHNAVLMRYRADGDRFELVDLDSRTGLESPLSAINRKYGSRFGALTHRYAKKGLFYDFPASVKYPPMVSVSPYGPWIGLGSLASLPRGGVGFRDMISLDGTQRRNAGYFRPWNVHWSRDGQRWMNIGYEVRGDADGSVETCSLRDQSRVRVKLPAMHVATLPIGVTSRESLLAYSPLPSGLSLSAYEFDLRSSPATLRRYTISLPVSAMVRWACVSKRGDRIAWLLDYDAAPQSLLWLHKVWPRIPVRTARRSGIWVSRLDGSDMREVGHVPFRPDHPYADTLCALEWLPGDRRLSFGYRGSLYTVPPPR